MTAFRRLVVLIVLSRSVGAGQPPRFVHNDLTVKVQVQVIALPEGYFKYEYYFGNLPESHQLMERAILEVNDKSVKYGGTIRNIIPPTEKNWGKYPTLGRTMRWLVEYDTTGMDDLKSPPASAVRPGESISFSFEQQALPTIGRFWAAGWAPWFFSTQEEDSLLSLGVARSDLHPKDDQFFTGPTVVGRALPASTSMIALHDNLIDYTNQSLSLSWIRNQATADKYTSYFNSAKAKMLQGNSGAVHTSLEQVLQDVSSDSTTNITSEAYALLRFNTEYLLSQLPPPVAGCAVKLVNSGGMRLTGGSLQFYDGVWKDATNNGDGTFTVSTNLKAVSLRMTYEYGSQTKSNVIVGPDTVVFQTANAQIRLQDSHGTLMDPGLVQYYAGAWRTFGPTSGGIAQKELLPGTYSFRMTYAYGSKDKQQDIGVDPVVVFQTINSTVELRNSAGNLIDQGTVQYYAGAWRPFGTTLNGVASKELLPNNYSFRMTYAYGNNDKQQDVGVNPVVTFRTTNAIVQLKNSQGALIDQGTVQYYAGAWRSFGTTSGGTASMELLPASYSFRMTYEYVSKDIAQDISTNSTVSLSTVPCTIRVRDAQGQLLSGALASYYAGAWRQIGTTVNGDITKELLPANLTFRAAYGGKTQDKVQDLNVNTLVEISMQP